MHWEGGLLSNEMGHVPVPVYVCVAFDGLLRNSALCFASRSSGAHSDEQRRSDIPREGECGVWGFGPPHEERLAKPKPRHQPGTGGSGRLESHALINPQPEV